MSSGNKKLGTFSTFLVFGGAAVLLWIGTRVLIPVLSSTTGMETVLCWFIVGGLGVFTPLLIAAVVILRKEGWLKKPGAWRERMRFRPMNKADWLWSLGAIAAIGVLSGLLMFALKAILDEVSLHPPFITLEPLGSDRLWLLAAWLPMWTLNIMGEEILWRGVLLPHQEVSFGRWAWLVHGAGWTIFHIAFGWQMLVTLLPILFILPYVVQRRKNSWIGVVVHGGLNGPGFIAVAFGLV